MSIISDAATRWAYDSYLGHKTSFVISNHTRWHHHPVEELKNAVYTGLGLLHPTAKPPCRLVN